MITLDFNKLTLRELEEIHEYVGISFVIENGKIAEVIKEIIK